MARGLLSEYSPGTLWPRPYSQNTPESAFRFLVECCWTFNEADKSIELIPEKEYIRSIAQSWYESRNSGSPLIIEKSRRLIASWVLRGLELWSMGLNTEKRVLCGLTYPKASEHVWRIWWLYEELRKRRPEFKLGRSTPRGGSTDAQEIDQVILPNRSIMETLNQRGQSFQGSGYSGVTMEEFSLYRYCEYMYGQAMRVTQGKPGGQGGHVVIVTNASTNSEWQGIKALRNPVENSGDHEPVRNSGVPKGVPSGVAKGVDVAHTAKGASYLRVHYSADPEKDDSWVAEERPKSPAREWDREMEMREDVWDGQPVYSNYREDWHAPAKWALGLPTVPGAEYYGGWDCGATLRPAFVLLQVCPKPFQIHALLEVTSIGGESMEDFAPRVLRVLMDWHGGLWDEVRHFGDATVTTRSGATGTTALDVARKHGIEIAAVSNAWAPRYAAVSWALNRYIDEDCPGLLVASERCPLLTKGFQGAYKFRESSSGESSGPGSVLLEPLKNMYSHVHDALQYPMVKIRRSIEGGGARLIRED